MFRLIRMLILFMSPEPVINHHFKPFSYRESLDISSKGAPNTESEVAPTYRSIFLFSGDREEEIWCEVNGIGPSIPLSCLY